MVNVVVVEKRGRRRMLVPPATTFLAHPHVHVHVDDHDRRREQRPWDIAPDGLNAGELWD